jgi:hypothetical protein
MTETGFIDNKITELIPKSTVEKKRDLVTVANASRLVRNSDVGMTAVVERQIGKEGMGVVVNFTKIFVDHLGQIIKSKER